MKDKKSQAQKEQKRYGGELVTGPFGGETLRNPNDLTEFDASATKFMKNAMKNGKTVVLMYNTDTGAVSFRASKFGIEDRLMYFITLGGSVLDVDYHLFKMAVDMMIEGYKDKNGGVLPPEPEFLKKDNSKHDVSMVQ